MIVVAVSILDLQIVDVDMAPRRFLAALDRLARIHNFELSRPDALRALQPPGLWLIFG
jgi:hypothetical protein